MHEKPEPGSGVGEPGANVSPQTGMFPVEHKVGSSADWLSHGSSFFVSNYLQPTYSTLLYKLFFNRALKCVKQCALHRWPYHQKHFAFTYHAEANDNKYFNVKYLVKTWCV